MAQSSIYIKEHNDVEQFSISVGYSLNGEPVGTRLSHGDSPYETRASATIGPIHLEQNDCLVLDHQDVSIAVDIGGTRWGYRATVGHEQIRQAGFFLFRLWPDRPVCRERQSEALTGG